MDSLVVSEQWWPEGTGGILASHLIARALRSAGFRLTVVHGTRRPVKAEGVNYVYTGLLSARNKHRLWTNCLLLAKKAWFVEAMRGCAVVYVPRYCYPLVSVAKKLGKRVIVHLHDYQPVSYNSIILSSRGARGEATHGADVINFELMEHASITRALFGAFTSPVNKLCRVWLKEADVIICVSNRQAEIIGKLAPELAGKLKVVYNPLPDMPVVKKDLSHPTFLYLGGDSYVKGFHVFLRASQEIVRRSHPRVKFLITRNLKDVNRLLIKRLNSTSNAYDLLGHLSYEEVLELHSRSYALLFPSIWEEPLPYAIIESMLAGTIPIASRVGGVPEIVKGSFAERTLFEPGNVNELVSKMEHLLILSDEQVKDIGFGLREILLRKFNREAVEKKLIEIFSNW
ncbi:MAG: glycosyltransferase family 4 protein [Candidatus Nezhaarchaeota archaeon]|nr:glycosyltransferase family 4 protein [Candidatus Nezhaarchaeota archaeon]